MCIIMRGELILTFLILDYLNSVFRKHQAPAFKLNYYVIFTTYVISIRIYIIRLGLVDLQHIHMLHVHMHAM